MKRFKLWLTLTVLMTSLGVRVDAHDIAVENDDGVTIYYVWTNDGTELAVSYRGDKSNTYKDEYTGEVVIPSTVIYNNERYSVTSIGTDAFYDCEGLTSVTIPNSVTDIGSSAFNYCTGLTYVNIPNNVTSIGGSAFSGCTGLTSINIPNSVTSIGGLAFRGCTSLTSINIPNSVTTIGNSAFDGCTNMSTVEYHCQEIGSWFSDNSSITEVIIGDEVINIGDYAFSGWKGLTSISLPNSVISISRNAFYNCTGLTSITIPNSVTSIGYAAFSGCTNITTVEYHCQEIGNWFYDSKSTITTIIIGDEVTTINGSAFKGFINLTSITIPNSVTSIANSAFDGCTNIAKVEYHCQKIDGWFYSSKYSITNVIIGDEVTNIGTSAFFGFANLESIKIPNSVISIGESAFCGCTGLSSITIPDNVITLGNSSFQGCTGLTSITIPNSVTSVGSYAFKDCINLTAVNISYNVTSIGSSAFQNCFSLTDINIPNSITSIGSSAFQDCINLTAVNIPNSVTTIGSSAFGGCSALKSVTLGKGIKSIESDAFSGCNELASVEFHCKEIGTWFSKMSSIKNVIIGEEVTSFANGAFNNCTGLEKVTINNLDSWCRISRNNAAPNSYAGHLYLNDEEITNLVIPETVTSIGDYAFANFQSITNATLNDNLTSIGNEAFNSCSNLAAITIPDNVESIGDLAFYGCTSLTRMTIPDKVSTIGIGAFAACSNMTRVTIGSGVNYIGTQAFFDCRNLSRVSISDLSAWCKIKFDVPLGIGDLPEDYLPTNPLYYAHNLVLNNKNLRELVIPSDVTSINDYAFLNCSGLTSIVIPDNVTSIGEGSFSGCSGLKSVTIPNSVNEIGAKAFNQCTGLESLFIGSHVTAIGENAFNGCSGLVSISSYIKQPFAIATSVFSDNIYTSVPLYVPRGCVEAYQDADGWFQFDTIEEMEYKSGDYTDPETSIVYHCDGETLTAYVKDGTQASGDAVIRDMVTFKLNEYVVNRIDDNAFKGCIGITSVTIPSSVETIGESAFDECTNLTTVLVEKNTPIAITNNVFANRTNMTLYVPTGYIEAYKQADYWKEFMAIYDFLLYEAQTLVADTEAVAIGKLQDAIDAYKEKSDTDALQSAIEVFKDENADVEKDETAKVGIEPARWEGATGWCATQYAPAITTYDGRFAQMVENFNYISGSVIGKIFYQTITGLTNGMYKIGFYANAFTTADRDKHVETGMVDGALDVAYVYANDTKQFVVAHRATSTTENGLYNFDVEVTDGNIEIGLAKEKEGTNWHTLQIYRLTWFASAKEVYAADKVVMQEVINEAKGLKNEYRTEGIDAINDAIASAEAALVNNRLNIPEFEAEIDKLRTAMENFRKINSYIYEGLAYVKDIETGLYMAAGSTYSTRGMVNKHGIDLTFTANGDDGTVLIDSRVEYQGVSNLGINLYMDSNPYGWVLERETDGYHIRTDEGKYISVDNDNNLVLSSLPRLWMIVSKEDYLAEKMNMMAEATEENPVDATWLINAPNFNRNDTRNNLWTVSDDCTSIHYKLGDGILDNNCATISYSTFTVSQTIENAPAGIYRMTAQGFYAQAGDITEEAPEFFICDSSAKVPQQTGGEEDPFDASEAFSNGLYFIEPIEYKHYGDKDLLLGIKGTAENQWTTFDNFQLTYYGPFDVPTKIEEDKVTKQNDPIYNLNGQKVNRNYKGLIIKDRKKVFTK